MSQEVNILLFGKLQTTHTASLYDLSTSVNELFFKRGARLGCSAKLFANQSTTQYLASGCHYIRMNVCTGSSKCVCCGLRWCCEAFCVQDNRILLQHSMSDEAHLIRVETEGTRQPQGTPAPSLAPSRQPHLTLWRLSCCLSSPYRFPSFQYHFIHKIN